MRKIILNKDGEPKGQTRWDPERPDETRFGKGYVPTTDEAMMLERREHAHDIIDGMRRKHPGKDVISVDGAELLIAVVWPSEDVIEAQLAAGTWREKLKPT